MIVCRWLMSTVLPAVFHGLFHNVGGDVLPSVFSILVVFSHWIGGGREEGGEGETAVTVRFDSRKLRGRLRNIKLAPRHNHYRYLVRIDFLLAFII